METLLGRSGRMAKGEAKARWDKENTVMVTMKLNKNQDAEIIAKLQSVPNKQGYIKGLIEADIAKGGGAK